MKRIKFSKKVRIALPIVFVFSLIFSAIIVSSVEARSVNVTPVSVSQVSAPNIIGFGPGVVAPTSVKGSVKAKAEVTAATKIVPIGRFDEDVKEDDSDSLSTSAMCAYVDFNGDGDIDTRDMLAYLNVWVAEDISADMNGDGIVDTNDYNMFTSSWKICYSPECSTADFNGDRVIDTRDVLAFLNAWSSRDESADVNGDGRVSGMDISAFFSIWRKCNV